MTRKLLKGLRLNRIDLVDVPANPGAMVAIIKRRTTEDTDVSDNKDTQDTEVAKRLIELAKRAEDAEEAAKQAQDEAKELKEEVAKRDEAEEVRVYIEKATKLDAAFGKPEEFGPIYRKLHKTLSVEDRPKLEKIFAGLTEKIATLEKQAKAFEEVGDDGGDATGDAWAKITKRAAETFPTESQADAIAKFLATPDGRALNLEYNKQKGLG